MRLKYTDAPVTGRPSAADDQQGFMTVQLQRLEGFPWIGIGGVPLTDCSHLRRRCLGCHFAAVHDEAQYHGAGIYLCVAYELRYLFGVRKPKGARVTFLNPEGWWITKR